MSQYSCFTISYNTKMSSIPDGAKTISVQFFDNRAPIVEATLGQTLTNDLKDYIQSNTRLILVNGIGDLDFDGEITGYDSRPTSISANDIAAQNRFTITVKVRYTNSLDSSTDWEMSFSRYQDYPNSESFESAQVNYTPDLLKLIIEDIYNKAFANW